MKPMKSIKTMGLSLTDMLLFGANRKIYDKFKNHNFSWEACAIICARTAQSCHACCKSLVLVTHFDQNQNAQCVCLFVCTFRQVLEAEAI